MLRKVTDTILYVGANDHEVDLFEGQYVVPNGMAYNSYVILDEKVAVMDTIDASKTEEWLKNIAQALDADISCVNVKATTEEHLGFTGDGSGMSCHAVCLLEQL